MDGHWTGQADGRIDGKTQRMHGWMDRLNGWMGGYEIKDWYKLYWILPVIAGIHQAHGRRAGKTKELEGSKEAWPIQGF